MIYDSLINIIRKKLFIVYYEKFKSETALAYIERFVAKHPLLKPELVVLNDQPHGFKEVSEDLQSLEQFPIYVEVEHSENHDGEKFVENVEMYAECSFKIGKKIAEVNKCVQAYAKYIAFERVKRFDEEVEEACLIYSKINEIFAQEEIEEEEEENLAKEKEVEIMLNVYLNSFLAFVKIMDALIIKGKDFVDIEESLKEI
jgi:hypothetical protein